MTKTSQPRAAIKPLFADIYESPLGAMLATCDEDALTGLLFMDEINPATVHAGTGGHAILSDVKKWLTSYFAGQKPGKPAFALAPKGTEFQRRVWSELMAVSYGETTSYGQIARSISCGKGHMPRAVGGAVGRNPIAVIIPCHRVIGKSGALTGFAAGLGRKEWLLKHEGAI